METTNSSVKLGRTELILVLAGLVAFISSFTHWFQASVSAGFLGNYYVGSTNGWSSGIAAWGAILLLMAVGVMALLPTFGVAQNLHGRYRLFMILAAIALVLVIIRWATYPTASANESGAQLSEGAGLGTFLLSVRGFGRNRVQLPGAQGQAQPARRGDHPCGAPRLPRPAVASAAPYPGPAPQPDRIWPDPRITRGETLNLPGDKALYQRLHDLLTLGR